MKKKTILWVIALLLLSNIIQAQVAINHNLAAPHSSAIFDVASTTEGVLIPRMSFAERDAIQSPATGLIVFTMDDKRFYVYNGSSWEKVLAGVDGGWAVSGNNLISAVSGNVGIGTTNPTAELEVASAGSYLYEHTELKLILYSDGANASPRYTFRKSHSPILGDDTSASAITQNGDILGNMNFQGIGGSGSGGSISSAGWIEMIQKGSAAASGVPGQFQITTSNGLGNRNTRFVVSPAGNVGIGTTSPDELLELYGNLFLSSATSQIDFINNSGSTDRMIIRKNPGSFGEINVLSSHDLKFRTNDTDRLIIEDNGDIDMNNNQIKNFRIENRTSDPTTPAVGQMWIRTDL